MTRVSAPLDKSTRSLAADWVELQVLVTDHGIGEQQLLRSQSPQAEPEHGDALTSLDLEPVDEEILEPENDELSERVGDELAYRERVLGSRYPFELVSQYGKWVLRRRTATTDSEKAAHDCYVACLLISAMHSPLLPIESTHQLVQKSEQVMQIESYLGAAELLGGKAYWFGFPRPDHSGMLLAIQKLVAAMGLGEAPAKRPDGLSAHAADGTVDIVVWRPFLDAQPGAVVAYGQVASGRNWESKPIKSFIDGHFHPWFVKPPSHKHVELLFVPILQHHKLDEPRDRDFWEIAREQARLREMDYGVVIDRLRLTELMALAQENDRYPDDHGLHQAAASEWREAALRYASGADEAA
ncbi:MAG: hypothetical protein QM607_04955 [Microbacterium sp.]